jgi:threonine dehydrogenase-like Zn-dependent dehydrogenase
VSRQLALLSQHHVGFVEYPDVSLMAGQLRLRSLYSAISHGTEQLLVTGLAPKFQREWNDDKRRFGPRRDQPRHPLPLGYECVAEVVEIANDVEGWRLGERIWLDAPHQETHVIEAARVKPFQRIAATGDPRRFAFLALTRVALGAVHDATPLIGDVAAITGAGAIGLITLQLLLRAGVRWVFVLDGNASRLELAGQLGGVPIDISAPDPTSEICETGPGCDFAIEASGQYPGLELALKCLAVGGRAIIVSSYGNRGPGAGLGHEFQRNRLSLISSMTINGCPHPQHPRWTLDRLNQEAAALLAGFEVDVLRLITKTIPFEHAAAEYQTESAPQNPGPKTIIEYSHA